MKSAKGRPEARRKPRVALVAHDVHDQGGMERAFAELIRQGHESVDFVVVSAELAPDLRPLVEWRRVVLPTRPFPLKFLAFGLAAGVKLRSVEADIVHTMGAIVPNRADVACVQFCHAGFRAATGRLAPPDSPLPRRLNSGLARALALAAERWCYRPARLRRFAAVSRGVAGELRQHYPSVPVAVTPNGVDPDRFRPDADVRRVVRAAQRVADEELVLLFVGGDWDRKGLGVAIEGMASAQPRLDVPLQLWVVGRGDESRFAGLAGRHGVGERICFFGPRADTERFFQASDVFVLPTLYETFSLVAYEAAASALPFVGTRVSGIDELAAGGEAGVLVPREPVAVADALVALAADPARRVRMGEAGRRRAGGYTWGRSVESVLSLYRELRAPGAGARSPG